MLDDLGGPPTPNTVCSHTAQGTLPARLAQPARYGTFWQQHNTTPLFTYTHIHLLQCLITHHCNNGCNSKNQPNSNAWLLLIQLVSHFLPQQAHHVMLACPAGITCCPVASCAPFSRLPGVRQMQPQLAGAASDRCAQRLRTPHHCWLHLLHLPCH